MFFSMAFFMLNKLVLIFGNYLGVFKICENPHLLASAKSAFPFIYAYKRYVLRTRIWRMPSANADENGFSK